MLQHPLDPMISHTLDIWLDKINENKLERMAKILIGLLMVVEFHQAYMTMDLEIEEKKRNNGNIHCNQRWQFSFKN